MWGGISSIKFSKLKRVSGVVDGPEARCLDAERPYKRTFAVKTALSTPCCSSLDKKCEQRGWIPGVKRNKRKRRREALAMPNARTTCSCATFIPSSLKFWDHSSRSKSHPPSLNNGTFYSFKLFLLVINPSEKLNHFIWRKKKNIWILFIISQNLRG